MNTWMVRAGRGGKFVDEFRNSEVVGLGWERVGDLKKYHSRDEVAAAVQKAFPSYTPKQAFVTGSQLFRFANEFKIGDRIVTYDNGARTYLCGKIVGGYEYNESAVDAVFLNTRRVEWTHETPRDHISTTAKNSLGAISTIFQIADEYSAELWNEAPSKSVNSGEENYEETSTQSFGSMSIDAVEEQAAEQIKDRISRFSWEEMQDLVAALLRAMGYKTEVSSPGPDRGRDIIASPDGFGFQEPRIVVEVKHRPTQRMGAPEIRSFLGARHARDKGLYVSTGGFSKDAYYEADRANIPLTLMNFEGLMEAILHHYDKFDDEARQILPLKPVYWLIDQ